MIVYSILLLCFTNDVEWKKYGNIKLSHTHNCELSQLTILTVMHNDMYEIFTHEIM